MNQYYLNPTTKEIFYLLNLVQGKNIGYFQQVSGGVFARTKSTYSLDYLTAISNDEYYKLCKAGQE